mmetsp:Transcript_126646/g.319887  ORF Transcript_126646/g.319887 Transcript_126646/m.319887 type:complete len:254 (-) Transcript_126646:515-1276(-)
MLLTSAYLVILWLASSSSCKRVSTSARRQAYSRQVVLFSLRLTFTTWYPSGTLGFAGLCFVLSRVHLPWWVLSSMCWNSLKAPSPMSRISLNLPSFRFQYSGKGTSSEETLCSCNSFLCLHVLHTLVLPPIPVPSSKCSHGQPRTLQGSALVDARLSVRAIILCIPKGSPILGPAQLANSMKLSTPLPSSSNSFQACSVRLGKWSLQMFLMTEKVASSSSRESFPEPSSSAQSKITFKLSGSAWIRDAEQARA